MKTVSRIEALRLWSEKIRQKVIPSFKSGVGCLYFNPEDGTQCAIGVLLPPEVGLAINDMGTIQAAVRRLPGICGYEDVTSKSFIEGCNLETLLNIQLAHDRNHDKGDFRRHFFADIRLLKEFQDVPEEIWEEVLSHDQD